MTTVNEIGNNLIAIQNRLLNERQALADEKRVMEGAYNQMMERMEDNHAAMHAFLDARIAEIDAMIGEKPEPMRMAAE